MASDELQVSQHLRVLTRYSSIDRRTVSGRLFIWFIRINYTRITLSFGSHLETFEQKAWPDDQRKTHVDHAQLAMLPLQPVLQVHCVTVALLFHYCYRQGC